MYEHRSPSSIRTPHQPYSRMLKAIYCHQDVKHRRHPATNQTYTHTHHCETVCPSTTPLFNVYLTPFRRPRRQFPRRDGVGIRRNGRKLPAASREPTGFTPYQLYLACRNASPMPSADVVWYTTDGHCIDILRGEAKEGSVWFEVGCEAHTVCQAVVLAISSERYPCGALLGGGGEVEAKRLISSSNTPGTVLVFVGSLSRNVCRPRCRALIFVHTTVCVYLCVR